MKDKLIRNNTIDSSGNNLGNQGLQWHSLCIITNIIIISKYEKYNNYEKEVNEVFALVGKSNL